ncbi:ABC transporter substrate-binding protein [Allonocardiopsis opalescens]|uniref:Carbohydrate ABC transporter substrate-binding protein (CUT1 family) n=1 Tax=Allonocardiopsis opalescens TaxID=1144618 RepID=A0A2T0QAW9_9ACTN|nr:extracellular solute-binding protein [Allonocardiopsis opalescens]PRY00952.1 carbohydrate ABC transporter substrate-binding protein (CUT1 family) [Allonocardiopsis opalescens]
MPFPHLPPASRAPHRDNARRRPRRGAAALALAGTAALLLAGCGGGSGEDEDAPLVFWTPHNTPERVQAQEATAQRFTEETGIPVQVVPLLTDDMNQSFVTGAASGDVPDVVLHGPQQTAAWMQQGLLDTEVPGQVVEALGADTFTERALQMVTVDGELAAVPSDGWGHLLMYREDLFDEAGIEPPTSLDEVAAAAAELNTGGRAGIAMGTQPADPFTTETMEALLLTNGCQLLDGDQVALDSPNCVEGLRLFNELASASGQGEFNVESARAAYLSGDAAMVIFSAHFLDEMAGLDPNNPVTCAECEENPRFLAENSGIVSLLSGPDNATPVEYGVTLNLGVPRGARTEEAAQFIEFLMGEGYVESLAIATEGRVPVRTGTQENPTEFVDAWAELPFGADPDNEESIADVYGEETVQILIDGANGFTRWGFGGQGAALAGSVASQNVISTNVNELYGGTDPAEYAAQIAEEARNVQQDIS